MRRFGGKLFGAAIGFSFGGPIGAIIGAAIGHIFDSSTMKRPVRYVRGSERELSFITSLILLLVGTAKADGEVTHEEIETIKQFFKNQVKYNSSDYYIIDKLINESIHRDVDLPEVCNEISKRTNYEERLFLIRINYQIASADRKITVEEEDYIRKASNYLGINEYDYNILRNTYASYRKSNSYQGTTHDIGRKDPYILLGIDRNCSNEELQKAYRNLASKYHPDKVSHLGKEFIELATNKFTHIQEAYQTIKKERGISQ